VRRAGIGRAVRHVPSVRGQAEPPATTILRPWASSGSGTHCGAWTLPRGTACAACRMARTPRPRRPLRTTAATS